MGGCPLAYLCYFYLPLLLSCFRILRAYMGVRAVSAVCGFVGLNEYPVAPFLYVFTVVAVVL